jgi:hypothetical protein
MFVEKLSQVSPVAKGIMVSQPLPQEVPLHPVLLLYLINTLELGRVVCVHLSTQPTWPQLYTCFVFCLLSFLHLQSPLS